MDILFLQETWLLNFQLPLLQEYFSSHISCGKAVDDENPLPPTQKPRGYGGVACMVRRDLDIRYKFHSNGGNRIMILEVQTEPPLCIIGVYMPVRDTTKKQDFQEILDEIQEIILTFRSSHVLFLVGDMNSSMLERLGNDRDKLLKCLYMKIHYNIPKMEHVPIYTPKIHLHLRLTTYSTQRTEQTWWIR